MSQWESCPAKDRPKKALVSDLLRLKSPADMMTWLEARRYELDAKVFDHSDNDDISLVKVHFEVYGDPIDASMVARLLEDMGGTYSDEETRALVDFLGRRGLVRCSDFCEWWAGCYDDDTMVPIEGPMEKDLVGETLLLTARREGLRWRFWAENTSLRDVKLLRFSLQGRNVVVEKREQSEVLLMPFMPTFVADIRATEDSRFELEYTADWTTQPTSLPVDSFVEEGLLSGLSLPEEGIGWVRHDNVGVPSPRGARAGALKDEKFRAALAATSHLLKIEGFSVGDTFVEPTYPVIGKSCIFSACCDPEESWVQLVQKAVAVRLGGYKAIESLSIADTIALICDDMPLSTETAFTERDVRVWLDEEALVVSERGTVVDVVGGRLRCQEFWGPDETNSSRLDDGPLVICRPTVPGGSEWHRAKATCRLGTSLSLMLTEDAEYLHLQVTAGSAGDEQHPLAMALLDDDEDVVFARFPTVARLTTAREPLRSLKKGHYQVIVWSSFPDQHSAFLEGAVVVVAYSSSHVHISNTAYKCDQLEKKCALAVGTAIDYPEFTVYQASSERGASLAAQNKTKFAVNVTIDCTRSKNVLSHAGSLIHTQTLPPKEFALFHHLYPDDESLPWSWSSYQCNSSPVRRRGTYEDNDDEDEVDDDAPATLHVPASTTGSRDSAKPLFVFESAVL